MAGVPLLQGTLQQQYLTISGCTVRMHEFVQDFLEEVMEEGMVLDGTIAQDSTQIAGIWGIREGISVALKHAGTRLPVCCGWQTSALLH